MFTLISYGGSYCNDISDTECVRFSTDIFQITIDISDTSVPAEWTKAGQQLVNARSPSPRSNPALISIGDSELLLFGGVEAHESSQPIQVRMLNDFWIYNIEQGTWFELPSNFPSIYSPRGDISTSSMMREFYNNLQVAYFSDLRTTIVAYSVPHGPFTLYLCALPTLGNGRIHCEAKGKLSEVRVMSYTHSMPWFSLLSSLTDEFHIVFHGQDSKKSFILQQDTQLKPNTSQLRIAHKPDIDVRIYFPGFQGCVNARPLSAPLWQNKSIYIFIGSYCPERTAGIDIRYTPSQTPSPIVVWQLIYKPFESSTIFAKHPSPSPLQYNRIGHTFTSVRPSMGILFGGSQTINQSYDYPESIWCLSIQIEYLVVDSTTYWRRLKTHPSQPTPMPRRDHVAFKHNHNSLVIQGGQDATMVYSDLWVLQIRDEQSCSGTWTQLTDNVFGEKLPSQWGHSATMYGDDIILFGDYNVFNEESPRSINTSRPEIMTDHVLLMSIKSLSFIHLRKIPLSRPVTMRFYHSLSSYLNNSFLLLGGFIAQRPDDLNDPISANAALLFQFREHGANTTVKVVPFFNFSIYGQHVVDDLVFSGCLGTRTDEYRTLLGFMSVNTNKHCPLGYGYSEHRTCEPCPIGYYSSAIAGNCTRCPGDLTTPGIGAWKCDTICMDSYCHGHGTCLVDRDDKKYCNCKFGYLPSDNCRTPVVYLSQLAAIIFSLVLSLCIAFLVKFIRKRRDLRKTEKQMQIQHVRLQRSLRKLAELNRGARMQWRDLTISKRLASGTYSKVYLAKLSDMDVVVKKLPKRFNHTRWRSSPFDIFLEEAETLRSLCHPNIVLFLGAGQDTADKCPFLVMEYLRRGSLYDNLHNPEVQLEQEDMLRFALDIARGMRYLHSSNPPQIHRDLKSPNLLVSDKWVVKIGDLEFTRYLALLESKDRSQSGEESSSDSHANTPAASVPHDHATADRSENETVFQPTVPECQPSSNPIHQSSCDVASPLLGDEELSLVSANRTSATSASVHPLVTMTTVVTESTPPHCFTASQLPSRVGMTCGVGTDRWRAPETLTENSYTEKSDVYSYGVVMWEIATRRLPYPHLTFPEDIHQEIMDGNTPVFPPTTPYPYRHLAEKCMSDEPRDRPSFQQIFHQFEDLQVPSRQDVREVDV
ncbi:uncharacterized protein LOC135811333 [Sycon ciliatum]|uniref:uncharacterized protein LOC135811333 n=1 Tax=Sycon ciliatum TaxID=27933 RepID=UPI0031F6E2B9